MRKIHFSRAALLHCLLLFSASFGAADDIQKIHPTGYVSDLAGVISPKAKSRLEALCAEVEQKTGAQMAMVPYLRQGDYGKATEIAAWQLAKYLADDSGVTLTGQPPAGGNRDGRADNANWGVWLVLGLILLFAAIGSLSSRSGGRRGGGSGGSGLLWFLLGMLAD